MKKLLLLLLGVICCIGFHAKGADVVESFASYTAAKNTWLTTTASAEEATATSTNTGLVWKFQNVYSYNIGNSVICFTFKKQCNAYMETTPGIECEKIILDVKSAGSAGGMDIYANEVKVAHQDITGAATVEFSIPAEYQTNTTKFKIVNTHKDGATGTNPGNQIAALSITFKEASSTPPTPATVGDIAVKVGDADFEDEGSYYLGDTFTFSAENAGYMYVVAGTQEELTVTDGVASWTPNTPDVYEAYVYAMLAKGNNQGMKEKELVFTLEALGDVVGTCSDGYAIENNGEYSVEKGTSFTFSSYLADQITITDIDDIVIATGTSSVSFTPDVIDFQGYTVKAERTWNGEPVTPKELSFFLTVTEASTALGSEIVIKLNDEVVDYPENETQNIYVQDKLSFYCKNADHIDIYASPGYGGTPYHFDGDTTDFPLGELNLTNEWTLTVSAYQGDDDNTENVVKRSVVLKLADREPLGDVIAMANGTPIEYSYDEFYQPLPYEVYPGTVISFACENADKFLVYASTEGIYNQEFDSDGSFTLTQLGEQNIQIIAKKSAYSGVENRLEFNVTVVEKPIMDEKWMLVTEQSQLTNGGEYLICAATSSKAMGPHNSNGNNRTVVDIEIVDNEVPILPENVQIVKFEASSDVAGAFNLNVGKNNDNEDQYLYVPVTNATKNNNLLKMQVGASEYSAATFTMNEDGSFKVEYTKATNEKAGRYMHYNLNSGGNPMFNCYTTIQTATNYEQIRLFKHVEVVAQPAVPVVEVIDPTKVSVKTSRGDLHVWVEEYDANDELINGTAHTADWTRKVAEEGEAYEINLPDTYGHYLKIFVKATINGFFSDVIEKEFESYMPATPLFDEMADDVTKVSFTSVKGALHVWVEERDADGNLVEGSEALPADWENEVAAEGVPYEIYLPETAGNCLTIYAKAYRNGYYSAVVIEEYESHIPVAPIFDQIEEDNTKVSFKTTRGELHIYLTERDKDGNIVSETAPADEDNAPMRAAAQNWTNKVADPDEEYEIAVPNDEGHTLTIQAKAVLNGYHSEEVVRTVDSEGQIVAAVNVVATDNLQYPVEYYNLQGVRVDGQTPGLYIRRQGTEVEKVLVK